MLWGKKTQNIKILLCHLQTAEVKGTWGSLCTGQHHSWDDPALTQTHRPYWKCVAPTPS